MVFVPAFSWALFALGGTQISNTIPGKKWFRRFILPAVFILACLIGGVIWWKSVLVGLISVGAYSLGYGESKKYWEKALVGTSYALITIPIGLSYWNLITAIGFITLFALSNWKPTASIFVHKIIEGSWGLFCGIQLAYLLMGRGIIW